MGCLPLELWDLIVSVLGNVSRVSGGSGKPDNDVHKRHKSQKKIDVMEDIDAVPSNVQSARQKALLYVFEDNEAVIKMIIKGRSPTMRHVSRTHDWLFDRINLDSKIQIKYIDTKNQLADILTKGNFTREEWNHLLNLFNISHFSATGCTAALAKTSSTRIRRRTCHSQIETCGGPRMDIKILGNLLREPIDQGNLRPSPPGYSKEDYGQSWSSQEWNSGAAANDRSGKPEKTFRDMTQQISPHREEPLLDGNAHSVRYGEMNS